MKRFLVVLFSMVLIMFVVGACANAPAREIVQDQVPEESSSVLSSVEAQSTEQEDKSASELYNEIKESGQFTVPEMTEEQRRFYAPYTEQLLLSAMLTNSWSVTDTSAISADPSGAKNGSLLILAFEDIAGSDEMQMMWKQYDGKFPEKVVEDVLAIFPFSTEQLHEILVDHYDAAEKVYNYEGGRGGGPIECAVTNVKTLDDKSVEVGYSVFTGYDDEATIAGGGKAAVYTSRFDGILTLKPEPDGGYSYVSVKVTAEMFADTVQLEPVEVSPGL